MTDKIFITEEKFKELSSEIAEKKHHAQCTFACCGSHEDFVDYEKCPKCGMTEEIQDEHNDEVWKMIDNAEFELLEKYTIKESK